MTANIAPLTYGTFYHIYNRGNNREDIFPQERNYAYFMDLWWKHTGPIAETWAYCLLRNHFHAAVYVRNREDLSGLTGNPAGLEGRVNGGITLPGPRGDPTGLNNKKPSQYFSNFFNAYSRGVNLATGRTGALFARPFKRIPVDTDDYLLRLIVYIHQNPQKHRFEGDFRDWKYSSYPELTGCVPTRLQREKAIRLFGSREDFIRIHREIQPEDRSGL